MSNFEARELQLQILEEIQRIRRLRADRAEPLEDVGDPEEDGAPSPLSVLLGRARRAMLEHPVAAQSAFAALMAEGRRYAETDEGAAWAEGLHGSDLVRRLRLVWEVVTINMFEEDPAVVLPSTYIETISALIEGSDLEDELTRFSLADRA